MHVSHLRARLFALPLVFALVAVLATPQTALAAPNAGASGSQDKGVYIVQLIDDPVIAYDGKVPGLKATKVKKGEKVDTENPDVIAYASYLDSRHNDALARAGGGNKIYDYRYSFNGFAAQLTGTQVASLKRAPGTLAVSKQELLSIDTSSTPKFLGLTDPGGLWDQLGGVGSAGEDIVIGVIDSGIWAESESFDDHNGLNGNGKKEDKKDYKKLKGWKVKCASGEQWSGKDACNNKLIAARWFNAAWGGDAALEAERPWEFMSPRDYNGHGTHTSSTAGGNNNVMPTGAAAAFGPISGIAPRARIAMYKALWSTQDASTASGFTSDLVAAVDQAVADGVDVINYSISGTTTNFLDPVEVAFLFAADAGVFVAASAGNSGPTTGTVAHPSPWITTVAAGTHNRNGTGSVTLGNSTTITGASLATAVGPAPFIDSTAAGLPGANATALALCFAAIDNGGAAVLDPAKVAGKIVLCDRGTNARVNKSLAVQEAGGIGMVLVNTSPNSLNADFHFVPSVHVADTNRTALKTYAATPGATARINASTLTFTDPAPLTAAFSSRGPLTAGGGDLLKPDIIAPGQDILASVAPPGNHGMDFNVYSGTSMSSPHVAGLAALLKDLHPTWSPMAIKSALMTSAYDVLDGPNTNPLVIFRQGAGHVKPNSAASPGLVYDSSFNDWLAFLCGTTTGVSAATCSALSGAGYSLDASDFNSASFAIGDLAGSQTLKRTVTNVGGSAATYTASVTGLSGFTATVTPSSFTIAPGASKTFTLTVTRTTATLAAYVGGQLTWTGGGKAVRSPIVVRPVALAAPREVSGTGGPISYSIKFGYTGTFTASARGLVPAMTNAGTVTDDPTDNFVPGGPGTRSFPVTIPAGTTYARFSLFNAFTDGADDLDLYVANAAGTIVAASGGGSADEEANITSPAAGNYTVWVHGFATDGPDSNFTLFSWLLGSTGAANMTMTAPSSATLGATGTINLTFSGLTAGTKYLGSVAYTGSSGLPNPTIVRVDP
jgi:subtilisin family serine protease